MANIRVSQSFTDGEVNVLHAMLEAGMTGVFKNPESTEVLQTTAQKVIRMRKKAQDLKKP